MQEISSVINGLAYLIGCVIGAAFFATLLTAVPLSLASIAGKPLSRCAQWWWFGTFGVLALIVHAAGSL